MQSKIQYLIISTLVVLLFSCGESSTTVSETAKGGTETEMTEKKISLTPLRESPTFESASLSLNGEPEMSEDGNYSFNFEVSGYELGAQTEQPMALANSGNGQHIHLIVDNGPYSAHYEPTVTTDKLKEDGNHVVLAFLSRSYHESVKNMGANKSYFISQYKTGEGEAVEADLTAPHMFYSRPKGTYKGKDTERLLLDFFLLNIDGLSPDGYKVKASINGEVFTLTEWVPYVIEGLPMGEISIKLELLDANNAAVPGPFNSVSRTVTLEAADGSA